MSNKFLSVNLRKKYSDNIIKNKPITKDVIIRVNNNRNRELSHQKGKKPNQKQHVK